MNQFDVITIGSLLTDVFIQSDEFSLQLSGAGVLLCSQYGDKVEVDNFTLQGGGGAGNTAVGFARRGLRTAAIGEMGTDALSEQVIAELKEEGVATDLVVREKREQTGLSVVLIAPQGGRTIMVHRGAASMLGATDADWGSLNARWFHVSSLSGQVEVIRSIQARCQDQQIGWSWNPGRRELELLKQNQLKMSDGAPTLFFVNKEEWDSIADIHDHFHESIEQIIVTNGNQGGQVFCDSKCVEGYTVEQVTSVDETGAGDAFAVGYISAFLEKKELHQAIEAGKESAASVVKQVGAKTGLLKKS